MIDDIKITTGVLILIVAWGCATIYAIANKDGNAIWLPFILTIGYGLYRTAPQC